MLTWRTLVRWMVLGALLVTGQELHAQNGGLSGFVYDKDFEAPLPGATL